MNVPGFLLAAVLLLSAALSHADDHQFDAELHSVPGGSPSKDKGPSFPGGGGFGMPGGGYGIPGWGGGGGIPGFPGGPGGGGWGNMGGGWGAGYGGPGGGYARGGIVRGSVVCKDRGPCYGKKLICPAKCFTSYSRSGKNYGYGGGGGGCTIDCRKKCIAYC
ncbi:hypothetical protein Taro_016204 [Colocasia esculenta]|uniref:Uncharacterized protein n=1 Tax=Colocasia esculenta TaxID=4460 RepID=A0A843UJN0_COLES|nr:hypothetical protein [Colocasia esculenta]